LLSTESMALNSNAMHLRAKSHEYDTIQTSHDDGSTISRSTFCIILLVICGTTLGAMLWLGCDAWRSSTPGIFVPSVADAPGATQLIAVDDPLLTYRGRFDDRVVGLRSFSWPASQISISFEGPWVAARLGGSCAGDRYLVVLDGKQTSEILQVWGPMAQRTILTSLGAGPHTVTLWKLSEAYLQVDSSPSPPSSAPHAVHQQWRGGAAHFGGFVLPASARLLPPPPPPRRWLEVVGDSDSAGFCADGSPSLTEYTRLQNENEHETWAAQLAASLNAAITVQAISGVGVLPKPTFGALWTSPLEAANCTAPTASNKSFVAGDDDAQIPSAYRGHHLGPWFAGIGDYADRVNPFDSSLRWMGASEGRAPDAVLLLVGPNDWNSTTGVPYGSPELFRVGYVRLLEQQAAAYAVSLTKPKLISVCGGSINGFDPCPSIQQATQTFNAARENGSVGYYTSMNYTTWLAINNNTEHAYNGCALHYNKRGHAVLASQILHQVQRILGWCDVADHVCQQAVGPSSYCKYWQQPGVCHGSGSLAQQCSC